MNIRKTFRALVRAAKRAWEMVNWPKKADEAEGEA